MTSPDVSAQDASALRIRLHAVQTAAQSAGIDALLISPGPDLRYVTGYDAIPLERLTCLVLPSRGIPAIVAPRLEVPAVMASPLGALDAGALRTVGWDETDDPYALVRSLVGEPAVLAVDNHMWAEKLLSVRRVLPQAEIRLGEDILGPLRLRKSPLEVQALASAGAAIDRVHSRMGEWLRPGRTEREVGRDIAEAIVSEGHATVDFVIVASGPNGASPHAALTDRVIAAGEPVVVDIGGTTPEGYCSDCTRMYVAGGSPDPEFLHLYEVLQRAQAAACAAVEPGVPAEHIDATARRVIAEAGYGDFFVHRTGHGIGVQTHEHPYIVAGNTLRLEPGMAFSIEPGIYLPDRFGARIEDILVCEVGGGRRLNTTSRDLVVL